MRRATPNRWLIPLALASACASERGPARPSPAQPFSKAESYERFMGQWSRVLAPPLITFAGIHDGDAVLDVGAGTGSLTYAVREVDPTGPITGIDPSADYIRFAGARDPDAHITFAVGDAQALELPARTFDRTLSQLVINFIPDRDRAMAEMIRVTKPGGTIAAAVWDYGEGMQVLRAFWDEAIALDPAAASQDEAHMPLSRRGELAALWTKHGLEHVEETELVIPQHFASFDELWAPFLLGQGPAGHYVVGLPKARQAELASRLRTRLFKDGPDRAIDLTARAWAVKGTVRRE